MAINPAVDITPRIEDGCACVDLSLQDTEQLYDRWTPTAPQSRGLDDDMGDYLLAAVEDVPRKLPIRVVVWLAAADELPTLDAVVSPIQAHFGRELVLAERRIRKHLKRGHLTLFIALLILIACLLLAELTSQLAPGQFRQILREGLVITGWVAIWRPLDMLLYDWWPLVESRRAIQRLLVANVAIRRGLPPTQGSEGPKAS